MTTHLFLLPESFHDVLINNIEKQTGKDGSTYWSSGIPENCKLYDILDANVICLELDQDLQCAKLNPPAGYIVLGISVDYQEKGSKRIVESDLFSVLPSVGSAWVNLLNRQFRVADNLVPGRKGPNQSKPALGWYYDKSLEGYMVLRVCGQYR